MQTTRAILSLGLASCLAGAFACSSKESAPTPEPEPTATPAASTPAPATTVPRLPTPRPAATPAGATPPPTTLAPPPPTTTKPAATPPPTTLAPTPPPTTLPPVDPAKIAALVAAGDAAMAQALWADAAKAYGEALSLDPTSASAKRGRARAETTRLGQTRTFVPDLASSEGAEGKVTKMEGFDNVADLNVRRAVKVPGRAELDGTPAHIKPGETYTVQIFLRNQDLKKKKNIKIANVNIHRIVNDKDSLVSVDWTPVDTRPKDRALVATVSGPWGEDVSSWILSVKLLSEGGDIYENRLVWK